MTVYRLSPVRTDVFCHEWLQASVTRLADEEAEFVRWCGAQYFVVPFGVVVQSLYRPADPPVPVAVSGRPFVLAGSWTRFRELTAGAIARVYLDPAAPLVPPPRRA